MQLARELQLCGRGRGGDSGVFVVAMQTRRARQTVVCLQRQSLWSFCLASKSTCLPATICELGENTAIFAAFFGARQQRSRETAPSSCRPSLPSADSVRQKPSPKRSTPQGQLVWPSRAEPLGRRANNLAGRKWRVSSCEREREREKSC